jgi:hypothetical protein
MVHTVERERRAVTFRVRGRSGGDFRCIGFLTAELDLFQFIVIFPDHVPVKRRRAMAEAITMANFGMKLGFFELDMDDGELRVHTASACVPNSLPESVVDWCVSSGLAIADRYYGALQSVSWGGVAPADAIFAAEHPTEAELLDFGADERDDLRGSLDDPEEPSDEDSDSSRSGGEE